VLEGAAIDASDDYRREQGVNHHKLYASVAAWVPARWTESSKFRMRPIVTTATVDPYV
jgi:hypothetical protein